MPAKRLDQWSEVQRIGTPTSIIPTSHLGLLSKRGFAHLTTLGSNGSPHSTPMWYGWDGQHLLFSTLTARQKYRNALKDPRVSVSITDPDNPYCYLSVLGFATLQDDVDAELLSVLTHRYLGSGVSPWDPPVARRVIMKVEPVQVRFRPTLFAARSDLDTEGGGSRWS